MLTMMHWWKVRETVFLIFIFLNISVGKNLINILEYPLELTHLKMCSSVHHLSAFLLLLFSLLCVSKRLK